MGFSEGLQAAAAFDAHAPFYAQTLETPRLTLRAFCDADSEPLYAIMADESAMRYTYKAPSRGQCDERLRAYAEQAFTLGYAPWTVVLRAENRVIGWGGLNIDPYDPGWGVEVAYCFHPDAWGKGFGTEVVSAALAVGFGKLSLEKVIAFVHPQNVGSGRVLAKCGFMQMRYLPQMDRNYYEVERAEWDKLVRDAGV